MKEIEAKFKLIDSSKIIKNKDFKILNTINVLDLYFDNEFLNLKSHDKVLRLRKENNKYYIAYKGPRENHDNLIVREEIESEISDFEKAYKIIRNLRFVEIAKVEKERRTYLNKKFPELKITIDKYPFIGEYIEIEGSEPEVYEFLKIYGFNLSDSIKKNCTELFLNFCKEKNLNLKDPEIHLTFQDEKLFFEGRKSI